VRLVVGGVGAGIVEVGGVDTRADCLLGWQGVDGRVITIARWPAERKESA
jgi:hypothetical protein